MGRRIAVILPEVLLKMSHILETFSEAGPHGLVCLGIVLVERARQSILLLVLPVAHCSGKFLSSLRLAVRARHRGLDSVL